MTAADENGLQSCRVAVADSPPGGYHDLSGSLVRAMTHFAAGDYQDAGRILSSVTSDQRVGVGGGNVERELIELVEQATRSRPGDPIASPHR